MSNVKLEKKIEQEAGAQPEAQPAGSNDAGKPLQGEKRLDFCHALEHVRQAAQCGDAKAKQAIRDWIRNSPGIREELGNVARYAERALIEHISGGEVLAAEAMTQQAAKMRRRVRRCLAEPLGRNAGREGCRRLVAPAGLRK